MSIVDVHPPCFMWIVNEITGEQGPRFTPAGDQFFSGRSSLSLEEVEIDEDEDEVEDDPLPLRLPLRRQDRRKIANSICKLRTFQRLKRAPVTTAIMAILENNFGFV